MRKLKIWLVKNVTWIVEIWSDKPRISHKIYLTLGAGAKSLQSRPTLCEPVDHSPAGSSVHRILQARILVWVAMSFSSEPSQPRDRTRISLSPALAGRFFTTSATWEADLFDTKCM